MDPDTAAVTVAPVLVIGTVMKTATLAPGAKVTGAVVDTTPLIVMIGVKVTVAAALLLSVNVVVTFVPGTPAGRLARLTAGSAYSTASRSVALLLPVLLSGVLVATVEVPNRLVVLVLLGRVVTKLAVKLAPGAKLPGTMKVFMSPLLKVTVPTTPVATPVAAALLVKVTIPVMTLPPGALAGKSMLVVMSAAVPPI